MGKRGRGGSIAVIDPRAKPIHWRVLPETADRVYLAARSQGTVPSVYVERTLKAALDAAEATQEAKAS